jgi:hypothetical protein
MIVFIVTCWIFSCFCFYMAGRASAHIWPVKLEAMRDDPS